MKNFNKYLTLSDVEERWGFYVTTAGFSKIDINQSYPDNKQHPKSHSFNWDKGRILDGYYVVFISKGKGVFETEKNDLLTISEGSCFMLFPGVWHRYKPDFKIGWEEYWVGFKGFYAEKLVNCFFDEQTPVFNTGLNENILKLYQSILERVKNARPGYHQEIAGITHQLLGILNSFSSQDRGNKNSPERLITDAKFLLRETLHESDTVENIFKRLPVSYSKLRKDFKTITGETPNQYQINLRLNKVKELLLTTKLSITEIAYQTGFESVSYLSKLFKKKNNMSPGSYRQ